MRAHSRLALGLLAVFIALLALHYPLLRLPYFWDEAGYYIPAALDFYNSGRLIPISTLSTGHTPLVIAYLALVWHLFGFSPLVTRLAMILVAAADVTALYALGRRVASRQVAAWSALLLALMPLFFAQSSLVHLDLPAALFSTLSVLCLLDGRLWLFALIASLAVLSKETAVVLLPVAWVFEWSKSRARQASTPVAAQGGGNLGGIGIHHSVSLRSWVALTVPLLTLVAWSVYYHHATGYWTGNPEYLSYNLFSTLTPGRIFWTLLRRLYEVFIGGFNWLLAAEAVLGACWGCNRALHPAEASPREPMPCQRDLFLLAGGLTAIYLAMLSAVGGAILPRYLLPIFPPLFLAAVILLWRLPRRLARVICLAMAGCFVSAWFINPPYPFPFEDNLAYADFIRLHQQAAKFLEAWPGQPRILTAWPASDELTHTYLGYVRKPFRVVAVKGLTPADFDNLAPESFDLVYTYSRQWEPRDNWLARLPALPEAQQRYFDYAPPIREAVLVARFRLRLLAQFERRGQWVRIYSR
jgi:hypothetical protein